MFRVPVRSVGVAPGTPVITLVLCIGSTLYEVQRFASGHPLARCVHLRKLATGTVYEVKVHNTGPRCSCPDFIYRRWDAGEKCKHIVALERVLLLPAIPDQP
jgi:hypothetical protein